MNELDFEIEDISFDDPYPRVRYAGGMVWRHKYKGSICDDDPQCYDHPRTKEEYDLDQESIR